MLPFRRHKHDLPDALLYSMLTASVFCQSLNIYWEWRKSSQIAHLLAGLDKLTHLI